MNSTLGRNAFTLTASNAVSIARPRGLRFTSCRGAVWLTVDGERDDTILQPGESFVARTDAAIVVSALRDDAVLRVRALPARQKRSARFNHLRASWLHWISAGWHTLEGARS